MLAHTLLAALLLALASLSRAQTRPPCGRSCRFFFCVDRTTVFLTAPGNVSNPEICRRNQEIDQVLSTGEALVPSGSRLIPISRWLPTGLSTPFPPGVFTAARIAGEDNSGIARTFSAGNQQAFLDDRCFILPITRYERVRTRSGRKVVVPQNSRDAKDCVAFVPRVFDIIIEAQWLSGDDLDLSVEEPDGTVLDFRSRRSKCGRLLIDANIDACGIRGEGIERIHYNRLCGVQTGRYIVTLRHAANCLLTDPPKPTFYEVRVLEGGTVMRRASGFSNSDNGRLITTFTYTLN